MKLEVTASALNVRRRASLSGPVLGQVYRDDLVTWKSTSPDGNWHRIRKGALEGWSHGAYLTPHVPETPGSVVDAILSAASSSPLRQYNWPQRGRAPLAYIKGMGLVFARCVCKLESNQPEALEMAKANTGKRQVDVLAHYADEFADFGMKNDADGIDTLRHLFALMIGMGMRESSGRYCTGRDQSASNTSSITAEAGLFQTSWNAKSSHPVLPDLFDRYLTQPDGFLNVFSTGITCNAANWQNFGSGDGKEFQRLSKECPAFGVEFAAIVLRNRRKHYGPINTKSAKITHLAHNYLLEVQDITAQFGCNDSLLNP